MHQAVKPMLNMRLFVLGLFVVPAFACNSTETCTWPYDNPYTTKYSATPDGRLIVNGTVKDCCAVMPMTPLVDTGVGERAHVIAPPSMHTSGAECTRWPRDVVLAQGLNPWRNGSLFKREKIFIVGQDGEGEGESEGHYVPEWGLATCEQPHPFYTKYVLARSADSKVTDGVPILGSSAAPDAALLTTAATIAEMLRQIDGKVPGVRQAMVQHGSRFAVWLDSERRTDTCKKCKQIDPFFDCGGHIDSRAGRDASYHPENPECVEPGGGIPTSMTEEYGIPYLDPNGTIRDSYCGTNVVAHEYFHAIHQQGIKYVSNPLYLWIEQATARATREGIYVHHPGAKDDGCNPDFIGCVAFEFIVKAHMTWNGFPADKREFIYQSRAEMKKKAPWIAELVFQLFEDGDWNPALGALITKPRDQTFGLTCASAPGSALCGEPLSKEYIGPPMKEVLEQCGGDCWNMQPVTV